MKYSAEPKYRKYVKEYGFLSFAKTSKWLREVLTHFYTMSFLSIQILNNKAKVNNPKLLNKPFTSCSLTNLDFFIPHTVHFDYIINLPFFVLEIFEFNVSVFLLHFIQ